MIEEIEMIQVGGTNKKDGVNEWLSLSEVAELLGVHPSTVRSWANQGRLPVHRTQGGHRRFRRREVDLYHKAEKADGAADLDQLIHLALVNTRMQISEGHLAKEKWYEKLDDEARMQYRQSGRALLHGLMGYLSSDQTSGQAEARALGFEYASRGSRRGLSNVEAVQAFLFFRALLLESMLAVYEQAGINSANAWSKMYQKINNFTDQILITLIETYEAYQRGSR